jgi:hypothetical protein
MTASNEGDSAPQVDALFLLRDEGDSIRFCLVGRVFGDAELAAVAGG